MNGWMGPCGVLVRRSAQNGLFRILCRLFFYSYT